MNLQYTTEVFFFLLLLTTCVTCKGGQKKKGPKFFKKRLAKRFVEKYNCRRIKREVKDGFAKYDEYTLDCEIGDLSPSTFTYVESCKTCWNPAEENKNTDPNYQPLAIWTDVEFAPTGTGTKNEKYRMIKACSCEKKGKNKKDKRERNNRKNKKGKRTATEMID
ncbi:uncharacterized protein LOC120336203 [Styela clava]